MEFHVLELPKFAKSAIDLTDKLDIWLYFFQHAEKMDTEALPPIFEQHPLLLCAVEELKMLTRTDQERERYESRRKAQLDYNTGLKVAKMEGRDEGRTEGEKIGMIHAYEGLLNRPETSTEELARLTLDELNRLSDDLQAQLRKHT